MPVAVHTECESEIWGESLFLPRDTFAKLMTIKGYKICINNYSIISRQEIIKYNKLNKLKYLKFINRLVKENHQVQMVGRI